MKEILIIRCSSNDRSPKEERPKRFCDLAAEVNISLLLNAALNEFKGALIRILVFK